VCLLYPLRTTYELGCFALSWDVQMYGCELVGCWGGCGYINSSTPSSASSFLHHTLVGETKKLLFMLNVVPLCGPENSSSKRDGAVSPRFETWYFLSRLLKSSVQGWKHVTSLRLFDEFWNVLLKCRGHSI
jgi:hypothetical protein